VGEGCISGVTDAPTTRVRGPSTPQLWEFPCIYTYTLWCRTTKFNVVTHMGGSLFLGGQPCTHPEGWGLSARQFLEYISIYVYTLWHKTTKFGVVTQVGEVQVSWVSHSFYCLKAEASAPLIFRVLWYLCPYSNAERPNSAWLTHIGWAFQS